MTDTCDDLLPLLAARALDQDLLEPEDGLRLARHVETCTRCPALARTFDLARASLGLDGCAVPDAWAKLEARLDEIDERARTASPLVVVLTCTYCHDRLTRDTAVYCAACLAPAHEDCWIEHGRCSVLGCGEARFVQSAVRVKPPVRRRRPGRGSVFLLAGLATAGAAIVGTKWAGRLEAPASVVAPQEDGTLAASGPIDKNAEARARSLRAEFPEDRVLDAERRARAIRDASLKRAANADEEGARLVARELLEERKFVEEKGRNGTMALLRALRGERVHPFELVGSVERFSALFKSHVTGPAVDGTTLQRSAGIPDGATVSFPEGTHALSFRGHTRRFPKDVTVVGAGMDRTILKIDGLLVFGEVDNLTFKDLTIDCGDRYFTDFRSEEPAVIHLVNCRIYGFDMGAGGSLMLSAHTAAFWAEDCRIESGHGRAPGYGNLFRVGAGLLARLDRCTIKGPFGSIYEVGNAATYVFSHCIFERMNDALLPFENPPEGVRFDHPSRGFLGGDLLLQAISGAVGGNPVRIDARGSTSGYERRVATEPLALTVPPDIRSEVVVYCRGGGDVPKGRVFLLTSVEYEGYAAGDTNGPGHFELRVGGAEIAQIARRSVREEPPGTVKDTWRGRRAIKPEEFRETYLEVSNSSQGQARIRGMVVPERFAAENAVHPLVGEELETARKAFKGLVAARRDEAEAVALEALSDLGPAVIPFLEKLEVASEVEAAARAKALERFGAGP